MVFKDTNRCHTEENISLDFDVKIVCVNQQNLACHQNTDFLFKEDEEEGEGGAEGGGGGRGGGGGGGGGGTKGQQLTEILLIYNGISCWSRFLYSTYLNTSVEER